MKFQSYPITKTCPYCGGEVILTTNDFVYGRKYSKNGNSNCYACVVCKSSVGTHPDGVTPLGILADGRLKNLKVQCHDLFDYFWKSNKMSRAQAYVEMAARLNIPADECHFGWFDEEMLLRAKEILKVWRGGRSV